MMHSNQLEHAEYGSAEEYFSIVRRTLLKRWWLIVLFVVAASIAGFAGSMLVEPVYRAATTIRIQQNVIAPRARRNAALLGEKSLETEGLWLKNRSLLEEVMDKTGIAATARSEKERLAVMEQLRSSIGVVVLSDSLQVTVDWNDATLAAKIANTLADSFIERYGAVNREEARELRSLLEQHVRSVHLQLEEAQTALSDFVKKHGKIELSRQGTASNDQLVRLQTDLAQNSIALAKATKRLELLKKRMGKDGQALSKVEFTVSAQEITSNRTIQALTGQIAQLEQKIANLRTLYTDELPELQTAKAQLAQQRQALGEEFRKLLPGLPVFADDTARIDLVAEFIEVRSEIEDLQNRQNELGSLVAKLEEDATSLPDEEAQYFTLLRNKTINEDLYNTFVTQLTEAKIAEKSDTWDVRVLERAYVPYTRLRPKPASNAAFGGIVGLLLGLAVCMLLEYLDDSFKTAEEVERQLQLPVLAVLPKFDVPAIEYYGYGSRKYH